MKKTLTILLSLALVICMIPSAAFAAGETMTASLSAYTALYSGPGQELPAVTNVKVGTTTLTDGQYRVQWTDSNNGMVPPGSSVTAAGTYTATIEDTRAEVGAGATVKKTFTIEKVDFKKASVTYSGIITAEKVDGTTEQLIQNFSADENLTVKYSGYSTPNELAYTILPERIKNNKVAYPEQDVLSKTECYVYNSKEINELIDSLWIDIMIADEDNNVWVMPVFIVVCMIALISTNVIRSRLKKVNSKI